MVKKITINRRKREKREELMKYGKDGVLVDARSVSPSPIDIFKKQITRRQECKNKCGTMVWGNYCRKCAKKMRHQTAKTEYKKRRVARVQHHKSHVKK